MLTCSALINPSLSHNSLEGGFTLTSLQLSPCSISFCGQTSGYCPFLHYHLRGIMLLSLLQCWASCSRQLWSGPTCLGCREEKCSSSTIRKSRMVLLSALRLRMAPPFSARWECWESAECAPQCPILESRCQEDVKGSGTQQRDAVPLTGWVMRHGYCAKAFVVTWPFNVSGFCELCTLNSVITLHLHFVSLAMTVCLHCTCVCCILYQR